MLLKSMSAAQYRSLRAIRMELDGVNVFIGANGVGKTNLYRGLQLVQAAVRGTFAREIAAEGGMMQALWAGPRRTQEKARIGFSVEVIDPKTGLVLEYRVEAGVKPPLQAGFAFEPQIKEEVFSVDTGRGPVVMMKRQGPGITLRSERGRMVPVDETALPSETAISMLAHEAAAPEIATFCRFAEQWRFFHGFRTDAGSPLRRPCLAVTAPLLDEDGSNLAAVFATISVNRGEMPEIDDIVADALSGAQLVIPEPEQEATIGLSLPDFPKRVFSAREFSDGQMRFLALTGRSHGLSPAAVDRAERTGGKPAPRHAGAAGRHDRHGRETQPDLDRHPFGATCGGSLRTLWYSFPSRRAAGWQDLDRGHACDRRDRRF
jgi:predicted ATPase